MTKLMKPLSYAIVAMLVAGGFGLTRVGSDPGAETYTVTAYFTKAIGLFPNSDVSVLGVPVGKVRTVTPVGTRVEVVMEIQKRHKIPADAFAQIVPISVISDRYIQLEPPYQGGPALADGAVLDINRTQIPAELDDVFKQLKKLLQAIEPGAEGEPGALGELIVQLDRTLRDREGDLRGTLINAAELTETLADAQEDISALLVNLDELFGTLATRAGSLGDLNSNFAAVMALLAESRQDLEGTLANLALSFEEVGALVKSNRRTLGRDLEIAARITATILKNRESVEMSLTWLPVVAVALKNAHHGGEFNTTDVRDNLNAKLECEILDMIPDSPVKEQIAAACREETGEPPAEDPPLAARLDCDEGVQRVRRQLRRLRRIDLPQGARAGLVRPLERQLRKLARECRDLGRKLTTPDVLDRILEEAGEVPEIDDPPLGVSGTAAGPAGAAAPGGPGFWARVGGWFDGWAGFLGWSR